MDAFAIFGKDAAKAAVTYRTLSAAACAGAPCPSVEVLGRDAELTGETMRKLLRRMEAVGLIRTTHPSKTARVVEITASGKKTAPTLGNNELARSAAAGWPKQTMGQEQFCAALGRAGRFEDSAEARRDPGSPRHEMPPRASVFSPCGISRVYDHGGRGQRDVAGRL